MTCQEALKYLLDVGIPAKDVEMVRKDACKHRLKIDLPTEVIEGLQKPYYGMDYYQQLSDRQKKALASGNQSRYLFLIEVSLMQGM
jgi:hypothetical protein